MHTKNLIHPEELLKLDMNFIEIDGSHGEGGGQILRTSVALSGATGKPIQIHRIRAGRPKPGLSPQHLHAIRSVQLLTDADVRGLKLGSEEVSFNPGKVRKGHYEIDVGTAGSVSLVLQTALLPALSSGGKVELVVKGGTDVPMSPPVDYIKNVFLPLIGRMGADADLVLRERGHYPKGGGEIEVMVDPALPRGLKIEDKGGLKMVYGISHCTNLPAHIAQRQRDAANNVLKKALSINAQINNEVSKGVGAGSGVVVWAEFENTILGTSSLGRRGKRAEIVGGEAMNSLVRMIKSFVTVDDHMADQLLPYVALARGMSSFRCTLTSHVVTNIHTVERILGPRFRIERIVGSIARITCQNP